MQGEIMVILAEKRISKLSWVSAAFISYQCPLRKAWTYLFHPPMSKIGQIGFSSFDGEKLVEKKNSEFKTVEKAIKNPLSHFSQEQFGNV